MRTPNDPRAAGVQQTAQPRSRRRFLRVWWRVASWGASLAGGINLYSQAQPGPGWGGSGLDMVPAALGGREPMIQTWYRRASSSQRIGY